MADQSNISPLDVKDYLAKSGISTFQKWLLQHKKTKNLAELLGFANAIESALPTVGQSSGFLEYFVKFKTLQAASVFEVWSMPEAYHWNAMTRTFLDANIHRVVPSKTLENYLRFLNQDLEHGLIVHLNDFGRFVLAAFLAARTEVRLEAPILIKLPSALPSTGVVLLPANANGSSAKLLRCSALNQETIEALTALQNGKEGESCTIAIEEEMGNSSKVLAWKMPAWEGRYGKITVNSFEPCFNLPYVEIYPRIHNPEQCEQFSRMLTKAFDCLTGYNHGIVDEMSLITASVSPMDTGDVEAEMCSGTSSDIFGACFLSATTEPLYLAEMLLHEFSHNKLRLLQEIISFLPPDLPDKPKFYSPWRDDSRPLDGILHGLFVFGSIARFWLSIWKAPKTSEYNRILAQRRVGTLRYQLEYASAEFSEYAELTDYGQVFLDEMNTWIEELRIQTQSWSFHNILPFFSALPRDKSLKQMPISEALPLHKLNWERLYRSERN